MKKYSIVGIGVAVVAFFAASFTNDEPATKEALGRLLFFDPILSKDSTISCASCHKPEFAFADTSALSKGVAAKEGTRNTPTAMNVSLHHFFFWDGRALTLEEQALAPISNPDEMNLDVSIAVDRLQANEKYVSYFKKIFNGLPDSVNLSKAIAAFERSLETTDSPFDEWKFNDDSNAVSASAKRGFDLFNGKGKCIQCHFGADLNLNDFKNIGLFNGKDLNDSGRYLITKNPADIGKFKIGSLRNVAITAPYMHNGMFKTLREVIDFYDDPSKVIPGGINRDTLLAKPMGLTEQEKQDLEAFMLALTDKRFAKSGDKIRRNN